MRCLLSLTAAAVAAIGLAAAANAQTFAAPSADPYSYQPTPLYLPNSGAAIGPDINCEPPGLPPEGAGALPPSNHSCR